MKTYLKSSVSGEVYLYDVWRVLIVLCVFGALCFCYFNILA
ncbi:MAG TPA: hypothetical protein VGC22_05590 [Chitinophaga sp.]